MEYKELVKHHTQLIKDQNQNKWEVIEVSDLEEICEAYHQAKLKLLGIADVAGRSAITYEQFQEALKIVNEYKIQLEEHYKTAKKEIEGISEFANVTKETLICDTNASVRLLNILRYYSEQLNIEFIDRKSTIKELEGLSISKFSQCRSAGKKCLQELKEMCFYAGVKLLP